MDPFQHCSLESLVLHITPWKNIYSRAWSFSLSSSRSHSGEDQGRAGRRGSVRRQQGGVALGLGRDQPWPRLALTGQTAGSRGAAAEQRQDSVAGSGSFIDGEHTVGHGSA